MNIFSSILTIFTGNTFFSVFSILNSVLIARLLGPELKGELSIFLLIASMLSLMLRLGLDTAIIKRLKDKDRTEKFYISNAVGATLASILVGATIFLLLIQNSSLIPSPIRSANYYSFVYAFMALETLTILLGSVLLGQEEIKRYSFAICLLPGAQLAFMLSLVVFELSLSISYIIVALLFGYVVKLTLLIAYLRKVIIGFNHLNVTEMMNQLKFGIKTHLGNVIDFFIIRTDLMLLGVYFDFRVVGIYSIAMLAEKINIVSTSVGSSLLANLSSVTDAPKINQIMRLSVPLLIFINISIFILSDYALQLLFGIDFTDAALPFSVLILGYSLLYFSKAIKPMVIIVDKPFLLTKASVICLTFNIVLNLALIPTFGMLGAAIATTVANFVYTIYLIWHYVFITKSRLIDLFIVKATDLSLVKNYFRS